jgi:hypothetical protein
MWISAVNQSETKHAKDNNLESDSQQNQLWEFLLQMEQ